jgi:hypothetical protein
MITGRWTFRCVIARLNRMRSAPCGSCTEFPPRSGERADPRAALRGFGGMTLGSLA